ncbi:MAG: thiamine-phosphate kinase [Myxococcales bacterium]|nr:thiamine-phosphate kinase [Myxococcales bacterium]
MSSNHHRLNELDAIALLERVLGRGPRPRGVELGIGDDAAVLKPGAGRLVWTVDACIEGVHFDRRWLSLEDLGWKSLMAAASDLAAMGAVPIGALSQLALPRSLGRRELGALARGQAGAAAAIGCPVIGGNLSRASELGITTTVLGRASRPVLRSGARAGDSLFLSGAVGRAALGLRLLEGGRRARTPAERAALAAWRRPAARIAEGRRLVRRAHAAIDVSDGLAGDAAHVAGQSGVAIVLEGAALLALEPRAFALAARRVSADPLELMLFGGEDYALIAASARAPRGFSRIGRVERGGGVWLERADGTRARITRGGYDHLRSR